MIAIRNTFLASLLLLLGACETLGIPTATSFNERLAVGYSTVTEVRQTATTLLNAKKLTADDGQQILDQTNNARAGLDVARTLAKTDLKGADSKLTAVRAALTALQAYLETKGGN